MGNGKAIRIAQWTRVPVEIRLTHYRKALAGAGLGPEFWSGRRDLNPRLRPWQGRTLPLSYSRSGFNYKQAALGLSAVANRYWCPAPPFSSISLARAVI